MKKRNKATTRSSARAQTQSSSSDDPRFSALVAALKKDVAFKTIISEYEKAQRAGGSSFGRHALRARGKIFAMMTGGHLVLKLPAARVAALIASADGVPFDANKGKPMKEWLTLRDDSKLSWAALAREAHRFVVG